jgi:hypothetical protein
MYGTAKLTFLLSHRKNPVGMALQSPDGCSYLDTHLGQTERQIKGDIIYLVRLARSREVISNYSFLSMNGPVYAYCKNRKLHLFSGIRRCIKRMTIDYVNTLRSVAACKFGCHLQCAHANNFTIHINTCPPAEHESVIV